MPDIMTAATYSAGSQHEVIEVPPDKLRAVMMAIKQELGFDILMDVFAVDWMGKKAARFEMDYLLYHVTENKRLLIKVLLADNDQPQIDTVSDIYGAADWAERECYDMYGIKILGHPNLKRLLMWDEFLGHPLRKDYPIDKRQPIPTPKAIL